MKRPEQEELSQREREFLAFFREGGPREPDFVRGMLKSAEDRAAVRGLWGRRLIGVVRDAAGAELWGLLPESHPKVGRPRRLDLGAKSDSLSATERAYVRRLHDLVDALTLMISGVPVTVHVVRTRIQRDVTQRHAERVISEIMDTSRELGFAMRRRPYELVDGAAVFVGKDEVARESQGAWALDVRSPEVLLTRAQGEIEKYVPRDRAKTTEDYALLYARRKEAGLCVNCAKAPPEPGRVSCKACAAEFRERRQALLEAGQCPECRGPIGDASFSSCAKCRAAHRRIEKKRREQGLCPECGERAAEGRAYCEEHAQQSTDYHAGRYKTLKELGLCRCKNPLEPGRATCADCRKRMEAAEEARYEERKSKGLCVKCGKPADEGLALCGEHREAERARSRSRQQKYRNSGRCRSCSKAWSGPTLDCEECRAKAAAKKTERAAQGLCANCGAGQRVPDKTRCQACIDAQKARYEELKKQGVCVTCKRERVASEGDTTCATCQQKARDRYQRKRQAVGSPP